MSPLEQKVADLEKKILIMERGEDPAFVEALRRYLDIPVNLNDLSDVDTSGVVDGEVIKYTAATETWENQVDIDT